MQEKFRAKGKKRYFGFVYLEKAFDRVLREVIRWAIRKLGVEEWLVSAVMSTYTGAKTVVRTVYGNSNGFEITVGMHQGSALSPLLFVTSCKKWVHRKYSGIKGSMYKVMKSLICKGCVIAVPVQDAQV